MQLEINDAPEGASDRQTPASIYVLSCPPADGMENIVKIGISASPAFRCYEFRDMFDDLQVVYETPLMPRRAARAIEATVFAKLRDDGYEPLPIGGRREWFGIMAQDGVDRIERCMLEPMPDGIPSRRDKAQVAFFVDQTTKRQLETIAFNERRKLQSLMLEACNMLFQSRGMTRTEDGD